jgi:hypothetical protein
LGTTLDGGRTPWDLGGPTQVLLSELQQQHQKQHQKQQQCIAIKKYRFGFSNELSFLGLEADLTSFPWQDTRIKKEKMDMLIAQ